MVKINMSVTKGVDEITRLYSRDKKNRGILSLTGP